MDPVTLSALTHLGVLLLGGLVTYLASRSKTPPKPGTPTVPDAPPAQPPLIDPASHPLLKQILDAAPRLLELAQDPTVLSLLQLLGSKLAGQQQQQAHALLDGILAAGQAPPPQPFRPAA